MRFLARFLTLPRRRVLRFCIWTLLVLVLLLGTLFWFARLNGSASSRTVRLAVIGESFLGLAIVGLYGLLETTPRNAIRLPSLLSNVVVLTGTLGLQVAALSFVGSTRTEPVWHPVSQRIVEAGAVVVAVWLLILLLRERGRTAWWATLFGWNPYVILGTGGPGPAVLALTALLTLQGRRTGVWPRWASGLTVACVIAVILLPSVNVCRPRALVGQPDLTRDIKSLVCVLAVVLVSGLLWQGRGSLVSFAYWLFVVPAMIDPTSAASRYLLVSLCMIPLINGRRGWTAIALAATVAARTAAGQPGSPFIGSAGYLPVGLALLAELGVTCRGKTPREPSLEHSAVRSDSGT